MNAPDLMGLSAGFAQPALDSQAVFRGVLQAFSHPGRPVTLGVNAQWPRVPGALCQPASAAVLLALLDAETSLWLSPSLSGSAVQTWLRFHTGCRVVEHPSQAQFIWAAQLAELPDLADLPCGTDAYPDQAATCLIDVPALSVEHTQAQWTLSGPGLPAPGALALPGTDWVQIERFDAWRRAAHALFPRGPDALLALADQIVGLPRTTQLSRCTPPTQPHQEP